MLSSPAQLPTPTLMNVPTPAGLKLRLRSRSRKGADGEGEPGTIPKKKKIVRRNVVPRGINKRRRVIDDDSSRDMAAAPADDDDVDELLEGGEDSEPVGAAAGPSTPKRPRLTPEVLPMGLERSDFLALQPEEESDEKKTESSNGGHENWTDEDDRILVELVLEKMKLSKSEWQDCARSLGKDRGSVGRRWKSLMGAGEVGLKRPRRAKLHSTWR